VGDRSAAAAKALITTEAGRSIPLFSQNFIHCFSARQLIDQSIQVANLSHGWFFDILHPDTADHAFDQGSRRIDLGAFAKKVSKWVFFPVESPAPSDHSLSAKR
jgi:hypothetical protein